MSDDTGEEASVGGEGRHLLTVAEAAELVELEAGPQITINVSIDVNDLVRSGLMPADRVEALLAGMAGSAGDDDLRGRVQAALDSIKLLESQCLNAAALWPDERRTAVLEADAYKAAAWLVANALGQAPPIDEQPDPAEQP